MTHLLDVVYYKNVISPLGCGDKIEHAHKKFGRNEHK